MKANAIVYTSNTGHTERYAKMLAEKLAIPVYELNDAKKALKKKEKIIYMGWLIASNVKGFKKAKRKFDIKAVCGVGLCPTGELLSEVRKAIKLHSDTPLFTLQGGMDYKKLRGINKIMIDGLTSSLVAKQNKTAEDSAMLELLASSEDYVSEDNLKNIINWWNVE